MKPERLQQIAELFHAARASGVDVLASADPDLRREVESLLAWDAGTSGAFDLPAELVGMTMTLPAQLAPGVMLGPYKIEARIGQGGMGEVWKARDTRLRRDVAIKMSRAQFSGRFEREAHAIAALNHPNICALYDVGANFLVMELLEGDTLAERLKRGKLSIAETSKYGAQIARALTEAHGKGIIHRDLKPGNVVLTKNGAKVLDFGLAKSVSDESVSASNAVMGTPGYMAPEQREGRDCDARTDLYALGLVLCEMATGTRSAPGVAPKMEHLPERLAHVIERCLAVVPDERWQSATDVSSELERSGEASVGVKFGSRPLSGMRAKYAIGIAALSLALIAGGVFLWQKSQARPLTDQNVLAPKPQAADPEVLAPGPQAIPSEEKPQARPLTDQDVLVMADFTNTTGDPAFDGALRQALAFELELSPFLKIMGDQQVNHNLKLMGRPVGHPITNEIAHEVCVREGQKATIGGSIAVLTKIYRIGLEAVNCQTGVTLAREQAEAEDKDHVLKAVAKAAAGMRAKLGESLASIQKTARNPAQTEVTTRSLEALKAFRVGIELIAQGTQNSSREAIPEFQRALELDPAFAVARLFEGIAYSNTGQGTLGNESYTQAFELIDRVSQRERLLISGMYYLNVTEESKKALDASQMLVRSYPRSTDGHHLLANSYQRIGEYEKALEQRKEAFRLYPRNMVMANNLIGGYMDLDRFEEAKAVSKRELAEKMDTPVFHQKLLQIAYMQGDQPAQEKEIQWLAGKPEERQSILLQLTDAYVHGRRRQAKELTQRLFEIQRRQGFTVAQTPPELLDAQIGANIGDCEAARKGNRRSVLCSDAPALRIALEQAEKNPPANPDTTALVYQRGLAALIAGKGAAAAAEFQKIVDHKGRNWGPLYSPAYLGLARSQANAGDTAKARRAYQDFLDLWKDADQDLPFYIEATRELAELR